MCGVREEENATKADTTFREVVWYSKEFKINN